MADDDLDPNGCRRLAGAVIAKAVLHEGEKYLSTENFELWCRVANTRPDVMRHQIRRVLRHHPPTE